MTKYFTNIYPEINLYKKPSTKSEIVTQMIYGDSFSIKSKSSIIFVSVVMRHIIITRIKKIQKSILTQATPYL